MIALDGAEYLLTTSVATMHADRATGIQSPGDINGDDYPDLFVALNRKGASAPSEHTWIEAYSGSDGQLLWSLQGKYDRDPRVSYRLGAIALVGDLDKDGVPDIYSREAHSDRAAFLISGREGTMLGRYAIERRPDYDLPKRVQDVNADGVPDLVFSSDVQPLSVTILSGKDLTPLGHLENLWPEAGSGVEWAMSVYHDDNGDGYQRAW